MQDWIIQKDGATFNTDGAVKAAQKIKAVSYTHLTLPTILLV